jgi:hypothetical protein
MLAGRVAHDEELLLCWPRSGRCQAASGGGDDLIKKKPGTELGLYLSPLSRASPRANGNVPAVRPNGYEE